MEKVTTNSMKVTNTETCDKNYLFGQYIAAELRAFRQNDYRS